MFKNIINSLYINMLFAIILVASNNPTGNATGKVTDQTGTPIIGANIYFNELQIGAAADQSGNFEINNIPVGKYEITISAMGYETISREIKISENEKFRLDASLREALLEMGSVVVTGTNTPHLYEDVPVKTEIIPNKLIEQKKAVNLAEALSLQTGVAVENECNNCNFTQVKILGFDGKYSQILIDGDPVISSLGGVYDWSIIRKK